MNKEKDFRIVNEILETDECVIAGIGTAEIKGYNVVTKVSLDYLERAIRVIKALHKGEKDITIDIAITDKSPLVIGEYNEDTNSIAGVLIAPRIEPK